MLKMISWNVNGLRAVLKKDFMTIFNELDLSSGNEDAGWSGRTRFARLLSIF